MFSKYSKPSKNLKPLEQPKTAKDLKVYEDLKTSEDLKPSERIKSFAEFWPFYLGEHRSSMSRALHYLGTGAAVGAVLASAFTGQRRWLAAVPFLGYGPAWIGHFKSEHNKPTSFKYPLWSLMSDFKMLGMAVRNELGGELNRLYGSATPKKDAQLLSKI